jgi:hypothetical protein
VRKLMNAMGNTACIKISYAGLPEMMRGSPAFRSETRVS